MGCLGYSCHGSKMAVELRGPSFRTSTATYCSCAFRHSNYGRRKGLQFQHVDKSYSYILYSDSEVLLSTFSSTNLSKYFFYKVQ